jgi:YD repeat-containing protein
MEVNRNLVELARQLAQDGKIDREEADRIVSEAIADGRIDEADRAALLEIKDSHWSDLWTGGAARRFGAWADGGRDAALIRKLREAEADGIVDARELERITAEADTDGLSLEEISTLRSALFGGTELEADALRQLERVRGVIPPHHRSDVGLRPPDPTPQHVAETIDESNTFMREIWDDNWTRKELDVDDDGTTDVIIDRTFGADGRLTAIAADTDGDGRVDHRQRLTYEDGKLAAVDVDQGPDAERPEQRTEYRYEYGADGRLSRETATRIEHPNDEARRRTAGRETATHSRDPRTGEDVVIFEGDRVRPDAPPPLRGLVPQGRVLEEQWMLDRDGTLVGRHVRTEIDDPEKMVWQSYPPPQEPEDDPSLTGPLLDEAVRLAQDGKLSGADVDSLLDTALAGGIDEEEKKQLEAIAARHRDALEDPEDRWRLAMSARSEPAALGKARELERNSGGRIDGAAIDRLLEEVRADGKLDPDESSLLATIYYGAVRTTEEAKQKVKGWVEIAGPITGPTTVYDIPATEQAYEKVTSGALLDRANELAADGKLSAQDAARLLAEAHARGLDQTARDELMTVVARHANSFERYEDARRLAATSSLEDAALAARAHELASYGPLSAEDAQALVDEAWKDGKVTPEERRTLRWIVDGAEPSDEAARGLLRRSSALAEPWEGTWVLRAPGFRATIERGEDGLVKKVVDQRGTHEYEYDDQHRVVGVTTTKDGQVSRATLTYDAQGRLLSERAGDVSANHTWRDDGSDLIDAVGADGRKYQREVDAAGRERRLVYFDGDAVSMTVTSDFDALDRVAKMRTEHANEGAVEEITVRHHEGTGKRLETIEERRQGDMLWRQVDRFDPNHHDRVVERSITSENGGSLLVENRLHVGVNAVRRGFATDLEKENTYRYDEVGRLIGGTEDARETYRINP